MVNVTLEILEGFPLVWVMMYPHSKSMFLQMTFKFWIGVNEN